MEKRLFLALLLTFIFLFVYSYFLQKYLPSDKKVKVSEEKDLNFQKNAKKDDLIFKEDASAITKIKIGSKFISASTTGGFLIKMSNLKHNEEFIYKYIGLIPSEKDIKFNLKVTENSLIFTTEDGKKKEFIFAEDMLKIKLNYQPKDDMIIFFNTLIDNNLEQNYQEFFYTKNETIFRRTLKNLKTEENFQNLKFAGFRDRYFCISLLPDNYNINLKKNNNFFYLTLPPRSEISIFIGPQNEKLLKTYDLESIVNYGFFDPIARIILKLLNFINFFTKNWGLAIVFLTFIIYILLFPFTIQSTKSMRKLAEIQPELNILKEKYKNDLQRFQKEQLELFKKYKINPLGGCLPFFFQIPIFFAIFQIFSRFIEFKGASFLWIKDLTLPDRAIKLPINIPYFGEYLNLFPIMLVILNILQQKFTNITVSNSEQKFISNFLLIFIGIIFYHFSSAIVLYWFIQNFLTFIYQLRTKKINA
ncbi:MAG: YidC/Oxa1 family insertase periplasmic-domain containing protein [Candidatus Omnitrophica bacterium]|nr:YidC/Oxa1 family insertase periplasmic-domain containing protein [Candidatus Omnitrophota bacterium]